MPAKKKVGLIVNPIAGMGGRVGLKGSDGEETLRRAIALGAVPSAPGRAVEAFRRLAAIRGSIEIVAYPGEMGEDEANVAGLNPNVLGSIVGGRTTAEDTKRAAKEMRASGADLLLFAGGDGTARDVFDAVDGDMVVLGIPAGVKVHSGVFAVNPRSAGDLAVRYLRNESVAVRETEVMDIDEEAFRENRLSARLYGYLKVPYEKTLVQSAKIGGAPAEEFVLESMAADIIEGMKDDSLYIVGPGTNTRSIFERLGLKKTLLGVDVLLGKELLAADVNESQILELISGRKAKIVVSVIGGQGFLFGRGSQQISPDVIRKVGRENIIVVATPSKLASLRGAPLLADTGDSEVDTMLDGYVNVVTGYGRRVTYRVRSP
ncbi:MAG: ATP-NAD kinase family protein [Thermoplasmata archaeon]